MKARLLCRSSRWKGYGGRCSSHCCSRFAVKKPGFGLLFGERWRRSSLIGVDRMMAVLRRVQSWSVVGCRLCVLQCEELKGEVCGD